MRFPSSPSSGSRFLLNTTATCPASCVGGVLPCWFCRGIRSLTRCTQSLTDPDDARGEEPPSLQAHELVSTFNQGTPGTPWDPGQSDILSCRSCLATRRFFQRKLPWSLTGYSPPGPEQGGQHALQRSSAPPGCFAPRRE